MLTTIYDALKKIKEIFYVIIFLYFMRNNVVEIKLERVNKKRVF